MFGFAMTGAGVGEEAGAEGEVGPDPPQAAPEKPMVNAARRVLRSFTGRIVTHRPGSRRHAARPWSAGPVRTESARSREVASRSAT